MGGRFLGPRPCLFIDGIKVLRTMGCVGIRFISNLLEGGKGLVGCTFEGVLTFPRCLNGDDGIHHEACIFMMDGAVLVLKKAALKKQAA